LEKETEQPVGQVGLMRMEIEGREEIALGYIIHNPFWRKGYAFEASEACIDYAFKELNAERVISLIRPENEPSIKVAQKLKMKPVDIKEFAGFKHLIYVIQKEIKF
jgi:RimJ/RimL family protein N-acetyltransferase